MVLVMGIGVLFIVGGFVAYFKFDHVQVRIDRFFDPAGTDAYQVERSLEAFQNGGIFGRGPGEGRIKEALPDAHADFIFAVAGEEFGMFASLMIVALFGIIVLRGLRTRSRSLTSLFNWRLLVCLLSSVFRPS